MGPRQTTGGLEYLEQNHIDVARIMEGSPMPELKFLAAYNGQTLDELISLEKTYRIDSLVLAMEAALDQKVETTLSQEERVILAVEALEREVNNGGYEQFFMNSSQAYAEEVESSLRAIGCPKQAGIAKRAVAALRLKGKATPSAIEKALTRGGDKAAEKLSECDEAFYGQRENIAEQLFKYVKKNRKKIFLTRNKR
jgi:hypothetical protein